MESSITRRNERILEMGDCGKVILTCPEMTDEIAQKR